MKQRPTAYEEFADVRARREQHSLRWLTVVRTQVFCAHKRRQPHLPHVVERLARQRPTSCTGSAATAGGRFAVGGSGKRQGREIRVDGAQGASAWYSMGRRSQNCNSSFEPLSQSLLHKAMPPFTAPFANFSIPQVLSRGLERTYVLGAKTLDDRDGWIAALSSLVVPGRDQKAPCGGSKSPEVTVASSDKSTRGQSPEGNWSGSSRRTESEVGFASVTLEGPLVKRGHWNSGFKER